ncbi:MAG: homoserine kinase [Firmicutes bacterium]|nr:homoserine kinase [Alicyclobacillaceae bacterium]MCL6498364.1 homoserine kinase [Bacillota bacterium]
MFSVRVPATSANLGPGYDTLGLALNLWLTVEWHPAPATVVEVNGEGKEVLPHDASNFLYRLAAATYRELTGEDLPSGHLRIDNAIPVARGLGSSAAAAVAAVKLAFAIARQPLTVEECFRRVTAVEHHMDNAAPAIVGGATLVFSDGPDLHFYRFNPPPLPMILAIPDYLVPTDVARRILPPMVPRQDAVFNAQRVGLWVYALVNQDWEVLRWASQDRLHQEARSPLLPGFVQVMTQAREHGALLAALSGSGSTVLAMTYPGREQLVAQVMQETFALYGVKSRVVITEAAQQGAFEHAPVSC